LSFGVDSIKSQRRFSTAAYARNHDEAITGETHIYIFQIMLSCSENFYLVRHRKWESGIFKLPKANSSKPTILQSKPKDGKLSLELGKN
jgi:hypothetical protein